MIVIYTDGSARGNPGPGGWGAVIADDNRVMELGGEDVHNTNNRMELIAAIRAIEYVDENLPEESTLEIHTDSEYLMKGITLWIKDWLKRNWRTAGKKPVMNKELWQKLLIVSEDKDIIWKHVAGHAGVALNERCDEIATAFADGIGVNLYNGDRSAYPIHF